MPKPVTLNEMTQLRSSGFGQPWPRHGLKMLHWFATHCVSFDDNNEMLSWCRPEIGQYGFHRFKNRYRDGVQLLPDVDFHYYVVGNLNSPGADQLPEYISEGKTGEGGRRNMDRVIVSLDGNWFDSVYITAHIDKSKYDINSTYCISRGLLMIIRRLTLEEFLDKMGYQRDPVGRIRSPAGSTITTSNPDCRIDMESVTSGLSTDSSIHNSNNAPRQADASTRSQGFWDLCTIL